MNPESQRLFYIRCLGLYLLLFGLTETYVASARFRVTGWSLLGLLISVGIGVGAYHLSAWLVRRLPSRHRNGGARWFDLATVTSVLSSVICGVIFSGEQALETALFALSLIYWSMLFVQSKRTDSDYGTQKPAIKS